MKHSFTLFLLIMSLIAHSQIISEDFHYESKFASMADKNKIHYIESGEGETILFLHGVPMWSYAWRNIIAPLSATNHCIALDFMGFGLSDKPDITYNFDDQLTYLTQFIESQQLTNITLVMTDIGGILGTAYARNNPENVVKLVYMEAPITDAKTFHKHGKFMQKMMFWMGGQDRFGYNMIVKKNMFIRMMPNLIKRKLSKDEKAMYALPFPTAESRIPLFTLPNSFPKHGKNPQPGDMADYLNKNAAFLKESSLSKLILQAKPGMLIHKKTIRWINENISNVKIQQLGKGKHLMEEDLPVEIAQAIQK